MYIRNQVTMVTLYRYMTATTSNVTNRTAVVYTVQATRTGTIASLSSNALTADLPKQFRKLRFW